MLLVEGIVFQGVGVSLESGSFRVLTSFDFVLVHAWCSEGKVCLSLSSLSPGVLRRVPGEGLFVCRHDYAPSFFFPSFLLSPLPSVILEVSHGLP